MRHMLRHAAGAALLGIACTVIGGTAAAGAPITIKDSYWFKAFGSQGDAPGERAGVEDGDVGLAGSNVSAALKENAAAAFAQLAQFGFDGNGHWEALGPKVGNVPGPVTYTGAASTVSGRTTSLAISPQCERDSCTLLLGSAGGGVWRTSQILSTDQDWHASNDGLPSLAIGSLLFDPTDRSGQTVYAGTGEGNGSSDSEAGLGLFKSTDRGRHWTLVPGSDAVAHNRSIAAIAVDPANSNHLWIGTAVARHGSSAVNGGRFTPPGAPQIGLYESIDGGLSFSLVFSLPSDTVNPASPNGSDFFRGGVSKISTYRKDDDSFTQIYFSVFDYGLYRSTRNHLFEQVFASAGGGMVAASSTARTEFALAKNGDGLRIYVGDIGTAPADFYRTDDGNAAASTLVTGGTNGGWLKLSNSTPGTPGFSSYNFCETQCSYDMYVASPPGRPDVVWLGGSMQYSEIFTTTPPSNGRAVTRSTNAGLSFTDMTNDTGTPSPIGLHPDQHAIAFLPGSPDIAYLASDGGVVRTSGSFADASAQCATRGISGADLVDCQLWLSVIPTKIVSLNPGLNTLQFQGIAVNPRDSGDVMGGTQDNGTWVYDSKAHSWFETIGGDGGPPAISILGPTIRMHSYTGLQLDVNFTGIDTFGWDYISDPLTNSGELASFYTRYISDPLVAGTWFIGAQHVWRTQDNGGDPAYLQQHCNEYTGDLKAPCGDWVSLGGPPGSNVPGDLTGTSYGADKGGSYVVNLARASKNGAPLWVATRRGRLFLSMNPNDADAAVSYVRIDTPAQPRRFISGIAVDPNNPMKAYVSFSGYDAYTPTTTGHVFEVTYNPDTGTATWRNLSAGLGDQPITGIAYDDADHRIYVATDFGVLVRDEGEWTRAAAGLPLVAVYQLAFDAGSHQLFAATHGRGIYSLRVDD